jgi:hypothetical protein
LQGSGNRGSRNPKLLDQIGFRGNTVAGLIIARLDAITHNLEYVPMFGSNGRG